MTGRKSLVWVLLVFFAFTASALPQDDLAGQTFSYEEGGISVEVSVVGSGENGYTAELTVLDDGKPVSRSRHKDIFSPLALPEVSFVEMDGSNDRREVFVTQWTGGAHCCIEITLHDATPDGWKAISVGAFDGDPDPLFPDDVNGDGEAEIATVDNAFLYRFSSYAGSYAPTRILALRAGKLVDVTAEPAYARILHDSIDQMGEIPASGSDRNAWLAAYAATLLLLGEDDPLDFAESSYDPDAEIGLTQCSDPAQESDCPQSLRVKVDFPVALRAFLSEQGYLQEGR